MTECNELINSLNTEPLVTSLVKLGLYGGEIQSRWLNTWTSRELGGYLDVLEHDYIEHGVVTISMMLPNYRYVKILEDDGKFYSFPVLEAVSALEDNVETGFYAEYPSYLLFDDRVRDNFLTKVFIEKAHIKVLIGRIKSQALKELSASTSREKSYTLKYPEPKLFNIIVDSELASSLKKRWLEANQCFASGSYLATLIMLGSILEGALFAKTHHNQSEQQEVLVTNADQSSKKPKLTLENLINEAEKRSWLNPSLKKLAHDLKDYRNFVHPREQIKQRHYPDKTTCDVAWVIITAALNDLAKDEENPI